ncbi:hypothetical protein DQ238_12735 [Geodermatophilus sp. TF02-6]|nr:hypothetical protein DQ238_12735 [Geodermatophilus sp. TF02-6]
MAGVRWLTALVPLTSAALVTTGVLDLRAGLLVALALEAALAVLLLVEAVPFRRAYRVARRTGAGRLAAAVVGAEAVWPPVVVRLARAEVGILRLLWWAVRRREDVGPGDTALGYAGRFGVVLVVLTVLGVLETGVLHVLVLWETVRWGLVVVSVYALVWSVGFASSPRQHPHLLRDGELVLRSGHLHAFAVPLSGLVAARRSVVSDHRRTVVHDGERLVVSVMGDPNVELRLDPPVRVAGREGPVARVAFWVDDPQAVARLLHDRTVPVDH